MRKIAIFFIEFYRNYSSNQKLRVCRFRPTCSEYALQAMEKYGFMKGFLLSIWRILRCQPFAKGGWDPT